MEHHNALKYPLVLGRAKMIFEDFSIVRVLSPSDQRSEGFAWHSTPTIPKPCYAICSSIEVKNVQVSDRQTHIHGMT